MKIQWTVYFTYDISNRMDVVDFNTNSNKISFTLKIPMVFILEFNMSNTIEWFQLLGRLPTIASKYF